MCARVCIYVCTYDYNKIWQVLSSAADFFLTRTKFKWQCLYVASPQWWDKITASCYTPDWILYSSVQFSRSVMPDSLRPHGLQHTGLPVHHQLPEFTQTHVHGVSDPIQPSHPLSFPSPPALNLSQHHGLFKWVSSSHQVAKILEFQLQSQSFQWTPRTDFL